MKYSFILSLIFYLCGHFYMIIGLYTLSANVKSSVNRLFVFLTSSLAIWSFAYSIAIAAPTAEESIFWNCFAVFGWGVFFSILLHFTLVLTRFESRLPKGIRLALIYGPAAINIILFAPFGHLAENQYRMVQTDFGWVNIRPIDMGGVWFTIYYLVFLTASIVLLVRWWMRLEANTPLKRQATYFLYSVLVPIFLGIVTKTLPDLLGKNMYPRLVGIFMMVPTITLFYTSRKFGLLLEKETKTVRSQDVDRLRMFETIASIYIIGAPLSFLVGHFGVGRPLNYELTISAAILVIGLLTKLLPALTKNHVLQNTVFLMLNTIAMLMFLMTNIDTAAVTIWSIYIIFVLFTVVLDTGIYAVSFTVVIAVIQIIFWMLFPEVPVIIDGNEYLTRIFIIFLSSIAVRYLMKEYALKIEAYRKFAKEQEVLEKISSSFISVDRKNAKEKVDEMFEVAYEFLKFDYMCLAIFDRDAKEATFVHLNGKDAVIRSHPYRLGMVVATDTLPPVIAPVLRGRTIIYEDMEDGLIEAGEEIRDFFLSRGIHSFFALPILVGKRIDGMLVVEYHHRSDAISREGRSYFLKMITNILGDTKKKTLYERRLYNSAYFDKATKLANRNMLVKKLKQEIQGRKDSEKIAVLTIELVNLKTINGSFGHTIGKRIVIQSAAILRHLFGESCYISRSSEGEFIVIQPGVEDTDRVEGDVQRLLDAFSRPISTETGIEALFVVLSVGVAVHPDNGRDASTLLKNADLAGLQAKNTNRKVVFYTEQLEDLIAENTLFRNRLFQSLQNNEFFLEFQPLISSDTESVAGIEALLRWTADGNKRVPPDRFIPILEQTGLIYDVGLWVLEQALEEHNRLLAKGFPPLRVSINLSVVQFLVDNFIIDVSNAIKKSGVDPGYIELEITESFFSENPLKILEKVHQLKDLGVSIAIDDFGSGYSSFSRLKLIPFDRLKIDKKIIDYIDLERRLAPLTEISISLARTFKASVTAEGVETKGQADFLKSIGCDEIQGFYYSKPLSPEALEEFLGKAP